MKLTKRMNWPIGMITLIVLAGAIEGAQVGGPPEFFVEAQDEEKHLLAGLALTCTGLVRDVIDAADEAVHTTTAAFGTAPGGGEGGQFDPTPVLSVRGVYLKHGECLNAHLSALVGSAQTYGVAPLALFQVTLTPEGGGGGPQHMVGHYETPYGIPSPAIALEAERDVDSLAANFFQSVGFSAHEVPPGVYTVDVWWAGAPPGNMGAAIGAAFVLKLFQHSSTQIFWDRFESGDTSMWSLTVQ